MLDWGLTSMLALYRMKGHTSLESVSEVQGGWGYVSKYREVSTGIAWRPVACLQPAFELTESLSLVPFAGASTFLVLNTTSWRVTEWTDPSYGPDCLDGCPEGDLSAQFIPIRPFFGFDVEARFGASSTLALSSMFDAPDVTDSDSITEVYVVYTRAR